MFNPIESKKGSFKRTIRRGQKVHIFSIFRIHHKHMAQFPLNILDYENVGS